MGQKIEHINIRDLVLWTENPRDPFDPNANEEEIIKRAINPENTKWKLEKLVEEMGPYFDYSELPTVVYVNGKPIVFDGNRRMVLAKIKHKISKVDFKPIEKLPEFPENIPCNVCDKDTALKSVLRKHGDSGSWTPLERDIFINKHLGEEKSTFLLFEEETNLISNNPHLNKVFVKKEILTEDILKSMGIEIINNKLKTKHSPEETELILNDISEKIKDKQITTRLNRGQIFPVLNENTKKIIEKNRNNEAKNYYQKIKPTNSDLNTNSTLGQGINLENKTEFNEDPKPNRRTKRIKEGDLQIFGEPLYLKKGIVCNMHRDIEDLYSFYNKNKSTLSNSFTSIIRMSLRLLCEAANNDEFQNYRIDSYVKKYFPKGKNLLNQNQKTTLANYNVTENSIVQLLHTGAHTYDASKNIDQTIAISIILGKMLTISHGKNDE